MGAPIIAQVIDAATNNQVMKSCSEEEVHDPVQRTETTSVHVWREEAGTVGRKDLPSYCLRTLAKIGSSRVTEPGQNDSQSSWIFEHWTL